MNEHRNAARGGYVITEALVVLLLTILLGATLCGILQIQARLARHIGERIAQNDAARVIARIVPAELRNSVPTRDIRAVSSDSIAARWFRASGVVCAVRAPDIWLRMRSMRELDPDKDSLLLITDTREIASPASAATEDPAGCRRGPDDRIYRMRAAPADAMIALLFESGSYYLSQRALRYRIGGEGRQPMTEEYLRETGSSFNLTMDSTRSSRFGIVIAVKPGMQHTSGRTRAITVYLPNRAGGS